MAELVEHDVSGLHFTPGSSRELREHLAWLIDNPEELTRLRRGIPAVKPIAEDAEFHETLFEMVIASREDPLEHHDFEGGLWGD